MTVPTAKTQIVKSTADHGHSQIHSATGVDEAFVEVDVEKVNIMVPYTHRQLFVRSAGPNEIVIEPVHGSSSRPSFSVVKGPENVKAHSRYHIQLPIVLIRSADILAQIVKWCKTDSSTHTNVNKATSSKRKPESKGAAHNQPAENRDTYMTSRKSV